MNPFHVTAFASSCRGVAAVHFDAARDFGAAVAREGWALVYGGNTPGPMGAMADACRAGGGRVVGVSPALFGDLNDRQCDEFVVADDMRHRKAEMERRGDAFVTLPGGIGTMEEFFEILVGRHLRQHDKPVILLDVAGYYRPLIEWLRRGTDAGFVRPGVWEQLHVAEGVDAAIDVLRDAANQRDAGVSKEA